MRALGVKACDRSADARPDRGLGGVLRRPTDLSIEQYRELARSSRRERRVSAAAAFDIDPRDTSTPAGMVALLARIADGTALRPESSELLLDIMTRSTTGGARIKGHLPGHVSVAHKTGTIGGTTNDVGIITLPGDAGRIAIAMFVRSSPVPVERRSTRLRRCHARSTITSSSSHNRPHTRFRPGRAQSEARAYAPYPRPRRHLRRHGHPGSGIFIVPATVLRQTGGDPTVALVVWIIAGVLSLLGH